MGFNDQFALPNLVYDRRSANYSNHPPCAEYFWSVARCYQSKCVTNTGVVRGHLLQPEQALQFARVIADRLLMIGGDLQQPASALAMAT
jgi:hypothetical protein